MEARAAWRLGFAAAGTAAFMLLYSRPWDDALMIVYDLAAGPLVFAFVGGVVYDVVCGRPAPSLPVRGLMLVPIGVIPVLRACGVADISGHLTCALAVGIYQASDRSNPIAARVWGALVPLVVAAIRLHWQGWSPRADTWAGLAAGVLVGATVVVWARRRDRRPPVATCPTENATPPRDGA